MSFVFVVSGHNIGKGKLREIYAIWYSAFMVWIYSFLRNIENCEKEKKIK